MNIRSCIALLSIAVLGVTGFVGANTHTNQGPEKTAPLIGSVATLVANTQCISPLDVSYMEHLRSENKDTSVLFTGCGGII